MGWPSEPCITVSGARTLNLKNITVRIPLRRVTLITGPGGSGKSALAVNTIYRVCNDAFVRMLWDSEDSESAVMSSQKKHYTVKAEVDEIEPLLPCAVLKGLFFNRPESVTIGHYTGLMSLLANFFCTYGQLVCPLCSSEVDPFPTPEKIVKKILELPHGTRFYLLAYIGMISHGALKKLSENLLRRGFLRIKVDDKIFNLEDATLPPYRKVHKVHVVVDRLVVSPELSGRIEESLRTALETAKQGLVVVHTTENRELFFSKEPTCNSCGKILERPTVESLLKALCQQEKPDTILQCYGTEYRNLAEKPLKVLGSWCESLPSEVSSLSTVKRIREISRALRLMGIDYLSPIAKLRDLSSGELQKLRLLRFTINRFAGLVYILDSPSVGLDQRGKEFLFDFLEKARNDGATVIVADNDDELKKAADYVIELGPARGPRGGYLCFEGPVHQYRSRVLNGSGTLAAVRARGDGRLPEVGASGWIRLSKLSYGNVREVSVSIPNNEITLITGPIASGKTSLARAIVKSIVNGAFQSTPGAAKGLPILSKALFIDSRGYALPKRAILANFLNIFGSIRRFFASLPGSRRYGFSPKDFSYALEGKCPQCHGSGLIDPSERQLCPLCKGKRYRKEVLKVKYKGFSISDLLDLTVEDIKSLFSFLPALSRLLSILSNLNMGHLRLGQSLAELSGSEMVLLNIVRETVALTIPNRKMGPYLCAFDVPASILHHDDIQGIGLMFKMIREAGHTILVCDSSDIFMELCNWVIVMGPGSGPDGGRIIYEGRPLPLRKGTEVVVPEERC